MYGSSNAFVGLGNRQPVTQPASQPAEAKKDQCSPPCVADVFHKRSSQLGRSCPNRRPWEKMRRRRGGMGKEEGGSEGGGGGAAVGRVAGLAKVRQAEAAGSVGTVREGMCEML